jgi:hypothetical protein
MGNKIDDAIRIINVEIPERQAVVPIVKTLPKSEIEKQIEMVCKPDSHYNDLFSAIGSLITSGISGDDLIKSASVFDQFISPGSESMQKLSIEDLVRSHQKSYPDQLGSRPRNGIPADCFTDDVYSNLPASLQAILGYADGRGKDVLLMSIITALSAAFSRYRFLHGTGSDVNEFSPHIMALVIGSAGGGKGMCRYAPEIVKGITDRALNMQEAERKRYRGEKERFEKKMADWRKATDGEMPQRPNGPVKYSFAISASDTTQAALVEIMKHNLVGCFAFDSEVDTLVQGNASLNFGGFSDIIRKAFHHEQLARQRKSEHESYIVDKPRLALLLSGTPDQIKKLIPSETNGLFSRFWYYIIPKIFIGYQQPTTREDVILKAIEGLQDEIFEKAALWDGDKIEMTFSEEQEQAIADSMQNLREVEQQIGGDISASWFRMVITVKRIAVTLAGVQGAPSGVVPENCFRAAMALFPAMKAHCLKAVDLIREKTRGKLVLSEDEYKEMKEGGLTDGEIAKEMEVSLPTLNRRKREWRDISK